MKTLRSYEFKNNERNVELRNWCDARKGRATALSKIVFVGSTTKHLVTGLSHYKSGRTRITDSLYKKIKTGIKLVEREEKAIGLNIASVSSQMMAKRNKELTEYFKDNIELLDSFNTVYKLKYAIGDAYSDRVYECFTQLKGLNALTNSDKKPHYLNKLLKHDVSSWLSKDADRKIRLGDVVYSINYTSSKLLTQTMFGDLIKNRIDNLDEHQISKVRNVMIKVDDLIGSNHPFAIAANFE